MIIQEGLRLETSKPEPAGESSRIEILVVGRWSERLHHAWRRPGCYAPVWWSVGPSALRLDNQVDAA
jgi:hypothetical protein